MKYNIVSEDGKRNGIWRIFFDEVQFYILNYVDDEHVGLTEVYIYDNKTNYVISSLYYIIY